MSTRFLGMSFLKGKVCLSTLSGLSCRLLVLGLKAVPAASFQLCCLGVFFFKLKNRRKRSEIQGLPGNMSAPSLNIHAAPSRTLCVYLEAHGT